MNNNQEYFLRIIRETIGLMNHLVRGRSPHFISVLGLVLSAFLFSALSSPSSVAGHAQSTSSVSVAQASASQTRYTRAQLDGSGVVIGIYDSGVNLSDPILSANGRSKIVAQQCVGDSSEVNPCDNTSGRQASNVCNSTDVGCFHGMAVASIAVGNARSVTISGRNVDMGGVAPAADVAYIRDAMTKDGTIQYQDFIDALNMYVRAVESGSPLAPDVINLSLGFPRSSYADCAADSPAKTAIDYLVNHGVVVIAASGNDGDKSQISYPACMSNVIAVGSSTDSSTNARVSSFSNMSGDVDIVAHGEKIWSPMPSDSRYLAVSGTSFAAPVVSGTVALMKQADPNITPEQVKDILVSSADKIRDPATGTMYAALNIERALSRVTVHDSPSETAQNTEVAINKIAVDYPVTKEVVPQVKTHGETLNPTPVAADVLTGPLVRGHRSENLIIVVGLTLVLISAYGVCVCRRQENIFEQ